MVQHRLLAVATLAGAIAITASSVRAQSLNDPNLVITPYLTSLSSPTGLAFSGANQGFVIEKETGQVKRFSGSTVTSVLNLGVQNGGERGLLGIALDPNFASNGFTYLYYSSNNLSAGADGGNWVDNRVARYQWNGTALVDTGVFRTFGTAADGQTNGPNHNGGPLAFGPDGRLYGATGDLNRSRTEQNIASTGNLSSGTGGIYRLDTNLGVPADNPFSGAQAPFYAYGVRNSFGMAFDPATGNLWDTENGPDQYDEINLVARGANSGWIKVMGPAGRDPQGTSDIVVLGNSSYSDPEFSFLAPVGITALQFLHGSAWGAAYDDAVIVGGSNGTNNSQLYLLRLNAARDGFVLNGNLTDLVADTTAERNSLVFGQGFNVATGMTIGADGALYVTALGSGTVYRIAPVPEPKTWILIACGLALLGVALRQRD